MITQIINKLFNKNTQSLGSKGEDLAVEYLKKQGYEILDRNFRLRGGEIDIIANDGGQLVFVEVKTRTSYNLEFIMATINRKKQRKISRAALYYITKKKYRDFSGRFDVIFVFQRNLHEEIEHIKDAFPFTG